MMIAALILSLAAFSCLVAGVATGVSTWYIGVIVCAGVGLVLWAVDWRRGGGASRTRKGKRRAR